MAKSAKKNLRKEEEMRQLIDEEKKFGVDHMDDDIRETGNSHCL